MQKFDNSGPDSFDARLNENTADDRLNENAARNLALVIDEHEFMRGCLTLWIGTFCPDLRVVAVGSVEELPEVDLRSDAIVVIFGPGSVMRRDGWLNNSVAALRAVQSDLKVTEVHMVAIVNPDEMRATDESVLHAKLQGFIPTSSSAEVAAAALRLVIAGGSYFPRVPFRERTVMEAPALAGGAALPMRLTPREQAVLDLLRCGTPNKIIAHRLGMSLSTVKAHVHNIIRKLNVRNRTEVAVTLRAM